MKKRLVAVICIVLAAVMLFTACAVSTPSSVVKKYFDAAKSLNIKAMMECIEPTQAAMLKGLIEAAGGETGLSVEDMMGLSELAGENIKIDYAIISEETEGDAAEVVVNMTVTAKGETESEELTIDCIKVNGQWYVSTN